MQISYVLPNACQNCQKTLSSCPSHRLRELFSHNAPPNTDEALLIRHTSFDDAPLLASLEEQIAYHTRELARATLARDSILAHPDHVKSLLHPIRSLPEDILLAIFMLCTQGHTVPPDSLGIYWAPWVLSQVCRRWRFIALSLPRLWTRLDLSRHYYDRHWNAAVGRLLLYLRRSGSCAINVNIATVVATAAATVLALFCRCLALFGCTIRSVA
ncbi:hypothetical protein BDZ89DRAFT_670908 [Hymenopellis radicata]|nr:hypothetical protein BDZ89DRAFT_670908 [Hymenopellis radicata]